ncbi:8-oxo-dGTP diphosphatase [uncultured Streptococcus sp.]|uniref:8-oxo-dGTP diphosphatase n=1 Tax=uncultured Streptococcus sp. TaxID=83427 RepID=UPI0028D13892|nr:8-oxo-dGTP diphosphatase [uncultured Streptococcus sp.]
MSRSQETILTNICLVEDKARGKVLMQYRSPERYRWSGYAFPGGHIEKGESLHDAVVREILEETGLTISHPKLVGVKNWHTDEGVRYIVFCYKATEFSGQIHSTEEGEISWVDKDSLPQLDLAYDMLELLRMMEDEELSEYYYHERIEGGWRKSMY